MCAPSSLDNGVTRQQAFSGWTPDKYQTGISPDLLKGITTQNWRAGDDTGATGSFVVDPSSGQIQYHPGGQGPGENYYNYDATTGKYLGEAKGSGVRTYAEGVLSVLGAAAGAEVAFGGLGAAGTAGYATGGLAGGGGAAVGAAPAATGAAVDTGVTGMGDAGTMYAGSTADAAGTLGGGGSFTGAGMDATYAAAGAGAGPGVVPPAAGGGGGGGVPPAAGGAAPDAGVPPPANPYATAPPASITGNPTIDKMLGAVGNDPAKLAMLGLALKTGTSKPQLPGAAQTALDNANAGTKGATDTINSGGMSSPAWSVQKSSIDAQYDQLLNNEIEAIKQNAANSGMGSPNSSMVVQQQIDAARERSMGARQQAYSQALSQNITAAVSLLSGGNSVLTSIAQMQLSQSRDAQATAAEVAALAAQLGM